MVHDSMSDWTAAKGWENTTLRALCHVTDIHCLLLQQLVLEYYIESVLHTVYFAG
jgi:hypothetical protein